MSESITNHEDNGQAAEGRPVKGDWIKLHRKVIRSAVFAKPELLKLWVLCLLSANYRDTWVEVHGLAAPVLVKRGQFISGRYALHRAFYPKRCTTEKAPSTLWRLLECLRDMGNVNIKTNSRFSLITIVNYGRYQSGDSQNEQADEQQLNRRVNSRRAADAQPTRTNKKEKKEKNNQEEGGEVASPPSPNGDPPITLERLIDLWNKVAGVTPCKGPTTKRRKAFADRVKDPTWVAAVPQALQQIGQSRFLRGEKEGGWPVSIDWLLKEESLTKVVEGQYDDRAKHKNNGRGRVYDGDDPMLEMRHEAALAEQRQREDPWTKADSQAIRDVLRRVE